MKHKARRADNGKWIKGSLLFDFDQQTFRIVTGFFDVPNPKTDDQFGVNAPEVLTNTIQKIEL